MFVASKFLIWPHVFIGRKSHAAKRSFFAATLTLFLMFSVVGCATDAEQDRPLRVYATTGYIADAVVNIAPDAEVITMVGPGGDPHTYQPVTRDIEQILDADLVLWNGLNLEAQMENALATLGERQLAVAELVPETMLIAIPETGAQGQPLFDPHIWNSPEAWCEVVAIIAQKLSEIDPTSAQTYLENAQMYSDQISEVSHNIEVLLDEVPEPRILITGHDAFAYFGSRYGLEVRATDFISTEAAMSAGQLSALATLIAEQQIPVIFQDNQANPQAITSLKEAVRALGWEVEVSRMELFADSLGSAEGVDTYLEVFEHNARVIADAFAGTSKGEHNG